MTLRMYKQGNMALRMGGSRGYIPGATWVIGGVSLAYPSFSVMDLVEGPSGNFASLITLGDWVGNAWYDGGSGIYYFVGVPVVSGVVSGFNSGQDKTITSQGIATAVTGFTDFSQNFGWQAFGINGVSIRTNDSGPNDPHNPGDNYVFGDTPRELFVAATVGNTTSAIFLTIEFELLDLSKKFSFQLYAT